MDQPNKRAKSSQDLVGQPRLDVLSAVTTDVALALLSFLSPNGGLTVTALVSQRWRALSSHDRLWRAAVRPAHAIRPEACGQHYKQLFRDNREARKPPPTAPTVQAFEDPHEVRIPNEYVRERVMEKVRTQNLIEPEVYDFRDLPNWCFLGKYWYILGQRRHHMAACDHLNPRTCICNERHLPHDPANLEKALSPLGQSLLREELLTLQDFGFGAAPPELPEDHPPRYGDHESLAMRVLFHNPGLDEVKAGRLKLKALLTGLEESPCCAHRQRLAVLLTPEGLSALASPGIVPRQLLFWYPLWGLKRFLQQDCHTFARYAEELKPAIDAASRIKESNGWNSSRGFAGFAELDLDFRKAVHFWDCLELLLSPLGSRAVTAGIVRPSDCDPFSKPELFRAVWLALTSEPVQQLLVSRVVTLQDLQAVIAVLDRRPFAEKWAELWWEDDPSVLRRLSEDESGQRRRQKRDWSTVGEREREKRRREHDSAVEAARDRPWQEWHADLETLELLQKQAVARIARKEPGPPVISRLYTLVRPALYDETYWVRSVERGESPDLYPFFSSHHPRAPPTIPKRRRSDASSVPAWPKRPRDLRAAIESPLLPPLLRGGWSLRQAMSLLACPEGIVQAVSKGVLTVQELQLTRTEEGIVGLCDWHSLLTPGLLGLCQSEAGSPSPTSATDGKEAKQERHSQAARDYALRVVRAAEEVTDGVLIMASSELPAQIAVVASGAVSAEDLRVLPAFAIPILCKHRRPGPDSLLAVLTDKLVTTKQLAAIPHERHLAVLATAAGARWLRQPPDPVSSAGQPQLSLPEKAASMTLGQLRLSLTHPDYRSRLAEWYGPVLQLLPVDQAGFCTAVGPQLPWELYDHSFWKIIIPTAVLRVPYRGPRLRLRLFASRLPSSVQLIVNEGSTFAGLAGPLVARLPLPHDAASVEPPPSEDAQSQPAESPEAAALTRHSERIPLSLFLERPQATVFPVVWGADVDLCVQ